MNPAALLHAAARFVTGGGGARHGALLPGRTAPPARQRAHARRTLNAAGEAGSEATTEYLSAVAADKFESFLDAAADGSAAAVVDAVVSEAAALAEQQGLATEVEALEEYAPAASPDDGDDPLALYDNETAAGMRQLVAAAKLSQEELMEGMVPEVGCCRDDGGGSFCGVTVCCLLRLGMGWHGSGRAGAMGNSRAGAG